MKLVSGVRVSALCAATYIGARKLVSGAVDLGKTLRFIGLLRKFAAPARIGIEIFAVQRK
jgi:hypothetical protein